MVRLLEKLKFTSIFSRTGSTECPASPWINQDISVSRVTDENGHLLGKQASSHVMGNGICCDSMEISHGMNAFSDDEWGEEVRSSEKHIESN